MGTGKTYESVLREISSKNRISLSPATLIKRWEEFVQECKEGYQWDISEYNHELQVRHTLEIFLQDPLLKIFEQYEDLSLAVEKIDTSFKQILGDDVLPAGDSWFAKAVLKSSGPAYAESMKIAYGIHVTVID